MPKVLLGVTGSIAAYKAASVVRAFIERDWQVQVVMTPAATQFVTPLTFKTLSRTSVVVEEFAQSDDWAPVHIKHAMEADAILIAPATANTLAKIANGLADNALTSTVIAAVAPLFIAPAMNCNMWENLATQENVKRILARPNTTLISPGQGNLACGVVGSGRMPEPDEIVDVVCQAIERRTK